MIVVVGLDAVMRTMESWPDSESTADTRILTSKARRTAFRVYYILYIEETSVWNLI